MGNSFVNRACSWFAFGVFLTSCSTIQNLPNDDVYQLKDARLPIGESLNDHTTYEAYKFRNKLTEAEPRYYTPGIENILFRPSFPEFIFWSNFSGNNFNTNQAASNSFNHQTPWAKPRGSITGSSLIDLVDYPTVPKARKASYPSGTINFSSNSSSLTKAGPSNKTKIYSTQEATYIRPEGKMKNGNLPGRNSGDLNVVTPASGRTYTPKSGSGSVKNSGTPAKTNSSPGRRM